MPKRVKKRPEPASVFCRITKETQVLLNVIAPIEKVSMGMLIHQLLAQYIVERGLEKHVAGLVAHAEKVDVLRTAWEKEFRAKVEQEVRAELEQEQAVEGKDESAK